MGLSAPEDYQHSKQSNKRDSTAPSRPSVACEMLLFVSNLNFQFLWIFTRMVSKDQTNDYMKYLKLASTCAKIGPLTLAVL